MISLHRSCDIAVVGAGLVGSLLSIYLARKGFYTEVFERRPDMRKEELSAGRSINLAVSTRGLLALRSVGLEKEVLEFAIPMRGRMIHAMSGELIYQPYGKDETESINSISRAALNKLLMTKAEETKKSKFHFNMRATGFDFVKSELYLEDASNSTYVSVATDIAFATDGSSSAIRDDMMRSSGYKTHESTLDYGYKELVIMPGADGQFRLEKNALHIWPRGTYMLIALPNHDGSFTCTLFLPFEGKPSFASLKTHEDVQEFFNEQFPDAAPLINDVSEMFFANPTGKMVTVKCSPWNYEEKALLIGDAAHAIVPFFGQGMNCGFEDLTVLAACMDNYTNEGGTLYVNRRNPDVEKSGRRSPEGATAWSQVFNEFYSLRKENTDAIADMAVENFIEMRDKVADPQFQLEKAVEKVLQREFPKEYRSRYSLVTFSNVPYAFAMRAGLITDEILKELCRDIDSADKVNLATAKELISLKLAPVLSEQHSVLNSSQ